MFEFIIAFAAANPIAFAIAAFLPTIVATLVLVVIAHLHHIKALVKPERYHHNCLRRRKIFVWKTPVSREEALKHWESIADRALRVAAIIRKRQS